jgi:hypothetical protein
VGFLPIVCAALGIAASAIPGVGKLVAIGLGILAIGLGILAYRRVGKAGTRLWGAGGIGLGIVAVLLGAIKVGLTLVVLNRLASAFR